MTITVFGIILGVIIVLASLVMIVSVLLQSGSQKGLGAVTGQQESFLSKNKSGSRDAMLAKLAMMDTLNMFHFVPFQQLMLPMIFVFGGAGMFVGIVGSWSSIRKFLNA